MKFVQNTYSAFSTFYTNRMRTFLIVLSISIGIAGVIVMMSLGAGAQKLVMNEVEKVGGPLTFGVYRPDRIRKGKGRYSKWTRNTSKHFLMMEDVELIRNECPAVDMAAPESYRSVNVSYDGKQKRTRLQATSYDYHLIREWHTRVGRFISDEDLSFWSKVCVVGEEIVQDLFSGLDPIGKEIKVSNKRFNIIGVMESRGKGLDPGMGSEDNQIFMPVTTTQTHFLGNDYVGHILIQAKNYDVIDQAVDQVKTVLLRANDGEEFFEVWVMKEELKSTNRIILIIELVLVLIASVSLIVGGIGTLNIMLVSVTERIPEIGLRKAVGAKGWDIRVQFLTESVLICLIGSVLGIIIGFGLTHALAGTLSKYFIKEFEWPSVITLKSILTSVAAGAAIGVFFGYYPASRASRLNPIEAIRHK
ncbi:TPA: FtsX-like permease family protein [Candidatus Poribacteria bacterium]|nr:FtsX-like permease family protein [Candidatus Poribacteria bacterium]HIO77422.1 FtsX-like permease family protein [Candidatus Poribacteria bacterium]